MPETRLLLFIYPTYHVELFHYFREMVRYQKERKGFGFSERVMSQCITPI